MFPLQLSYTQHTQRKDNYTACVCINWIMECFVLAICLLSVQPATCTRSPKVRLSDRWENNHILTIHTHTHRHMDFQKHTHVNIQVAAWIPLSLSVRENCSASPFQKSLVCVFVVDCLLFNKHFNVSLKCHFAQ